MNLPLTIKSIQLWRYNRRIALFYFKSLRKKFNSYEFGYGAIYPRCYMKWKGYGDIRIWFIYDPDKSYVSNFAQVMDRERLGVDTFKIPCGIAKRINRYLNRRLYKERRKSYVNETLEQREKAYHNIGGKLR